MDEAGAVSQLLDALPMAETMEPAVRARAEALVKNIRRQRSAAGIEAFLHEYGLNTREGVAIMCLAEALLRIPDGETADRLIHDKLGGAEWSRHLGGSESLFVNASSWGLFLTGKVVTLGETSAIGKLVSKFGEPVVREALKSAMRLIGSQFVLGEGVKEALKETAPYLKKRYSFSYDILGEGARSDAQAEGYMKAYREAITHISKQARGKPLFEAPGLSVKLSALHPRFQLTQKERVMDELLPRIREIALLAKKHGVAISIDAEESSRLDISLLLFSRLFADKAFTGWNGLGFVVQAYQKRAFYLIAYLEKLARRHHRILPLRLVKGAYWDSEIKWAQTLGLPEYPVFTRKEHTDVSYLACADRILASTDCFYPQFATHNARTLATIEWLAKQHHVSADAFEFQRLFGMGEKLYEQLVSDYRCRIYAPIGPHKDLLAYLIRRLLENGANTSFVHLLMDENTPLFDLVADPVAKARRSGGKGNTDIPLPAGIYGDRKNSSGIDLGNLAMVEALEKALAAAPAKLPAAPEEATARHIAAAIAAAANQFPRWAETPVSERAYALNNAADHLEKNSAELIALLAREAGKTIADGIGEVREAADFCRYYAAQAGQLLAQPQPFTGPTGEHNALKLSPRGVFGCISPWNFPLSIFIGQVAAALATGNCVVAKPAEQTPRIARRAAELLYTAGIPRQALQLVYGDGKAGAALVEDERISGIVFTGSVETAKSIHRALAARPGPIVPFIAETGGINCMVVDSSALLEQAVDDILLSAFGGAGQRCSALRVLYAQQDIADALIALLEGAMQELALDDSLALSTDIGPVIDAEARKSLHRHIERMQKEARLIAAAPLSPSVAAGGHFVAPRAYEIKTIRQLPEEIFGPVLHVVRFSASKLEQVAADINSTGYGLTFGLASRIQERVDFFAARIRAGNFYVNRSMVGAVVGVQPFGGEGLSGTGPKAGGPHYLPRFLTERSLTVNTAAIGGNLQLLSGS